MPLCFVLSVFIKEAVIEKTMQLKKMSSNAKFKKNSEKKKVTKIHFREIYLNLYMPKMNGGITGHVSEIKFY